MFTHVLIPTDGSPLSAQALERGLEFARDAGAKVTVLTVVEPFHLLSTDPDQLAETEATYRQRTASQAAKLLAAAEHSAKILGVPCHVLQVEDEHPYSAIIDTAAAHNCDLIAMASHGRRGVSALILGSETMKVLTHSKIPVLVYR
jgi:nucleotide-binding universal stress UspA family protein